MLLKVQWQSTWTSNSITANPVTCCCRIGPVKLTSALCSGTLQAALLLLEKTWSPGDCKWTEQNRRGEERRFKRRQYVGSGTDPKNMTPSPKHPSCSFSSLKYHRCHIVVVHDTASIRLALASSKVKSQAFCSSNALCSVLRFNNDARKQICHNSKHRAIATPEN